MQRPSFQDVTMEVQQQDQVQEDFELGSMDEMISISTLDNWPKVTLSERFREYIRRPWSNCIIVK